MTAGAADIHNLQRLLRQQLMGLPVFPGTDLIHWENTKFDPPSPVDGEWWRESMLIVGTNKVATGQVRTLGVYQISLFKAVGSGALDLKNHAMEVVQGFEVGTSLSSTALGVSLNIYRSEQLHGRADPGRTPLWYSIPVRVYWRAYAATSVP